MLVKVKLSWQERFEWLLVGLDCLLEDETIWHGFQNFCACLDTFVKGYVWKSKTSPYVSLA